MIDEDVYQLAENELNSDKRRADVWARACSLAGEDHDEARFLYINLRVEDLLAEEESGRSADEFAHARDPQTSNQALDVLDNLKSEATDAPASTSTGRDAIDARGVDAFAAMSLDADQAPGHSSQIGLSIEDQAQHFDPLTEPASEDEFDSLTLPGDDADPDDSFAGDDVVGAFDPEQYRADLEDSDLLEAKASEQTSADLIASLVEAEKAAQEAAKETAQQAAQVASHDAAQEAVQQVIDSPRSDSSIDDAVSVTVLEKAEAMVSAANPELDLTLQPDQPLATNTASSLNAATTTAAVGATATAAVVATTVTTPVIDRSSIANTAHLHREGYALDAGGSTAYQVFQRSDGAVRAVKDGSSWLAALFTLPWLVMRGMLGTAFVYVVMAAAIVVGVLFTGSQWLDAGSSATLPVRLWALGFLALAVVGLFLIPLVRANKWRVRQLERAGFGFQTRVRANSKGQAISHAEKYMNS